jgi:hypothetical protein
MIEPGLTLNHWLSYILVYDAGKAKSPRNVLYSDKDATAYFKALCIISLIFPTKCCVFHVTFLCLYSVARFIYRMF